MVNTLVSTLDEPLITQSPNSTVRVSKTLLTAIYKGTCLRQRLHIKEVKPIKQESYLVYVNYGNMNPCVRVPSPSQAIIETQALTHLEQLTFEDTFERED